jgi:glycosyltransferase involved in cell wall biosynthesis
MPFVSVVIPTKGRPHLLLRAVRSVLDQHYRDLELIVVVDDDAATEKQLALVDDPRLRVIVNPQSLGANLARNVGGRAALGPWVAFLDDDDEWLPTKLERQLALVPPDAQNVIATCRTLVITPSGQSVLPRNVYDNESPFDEWLFDRRSLFGGQSFLQTSSLMMPTALFQTVLFRPRVQHDEWDLVLRARTQCELSIVTASDVLVRHYAGEERVSLSNSHNVAESLEWINTTRHSISRRAYSGFCLTVIARHIAKGGHPSDFFRTLALAFRHGAPTAAQLLVYLAAWLVPDGVRQRVRYAIPGVSGKSDATKRALAPSDARRSNR